MADETVRILLEVQKKNLEYISELSQKLNDATGQVEIQKRKVEELGQRFEKSESAMLKARRAIIAIRREMFALSFTIGAAIGVLKLLSTQSDELGLIFERSGDSVKSWMNKIGDATAFELNFCGALLSLYGYIEKGRF